MWNKIGATCRVVLFAGLLAVCGVMLVSGMSNAGYAAGSGDSTAAQPQTGKSMAKGTNEPGAADVVDAKGEAIAIFAGGCFWCMEQAMEKVAGVKNAISGYIGGTVKNPTYRQVSAGGTGHTEAVKVIYDPKIVGYQTLLTTFWHNIDPLVADRQFCDGGTQYRAGIFYLNDAQRKLAQASKDKLIAQKIFKQPIVTEVTKASTFWPAEEYHQNYYNKNPIRYNYYKFACGRKKRLKQLWGGYKKSS